jgi:crotonobetainyl-CoA:carnitine CoA-transferase CaiB-like acyl-CoA transferase
MLNDCLAGIRVLDLSQYIPGPYATLLMADLGAEVVKVEPPSGDPMRGLPPLGPDGQSRLYDVVNRGKTIVRLDLKNAADKAMLAELVKSADVLLESYRPGVMERLGFGWERLKQLNPRLVHCALSGFGQTGPLRLRAGHDNTYLALAGALHASGTGEEEAPVMPYPPFADHAGAMQAVIATLGALVRRSTTGRGGTLDVSIYETALTLQYLNHVTATSDPAERGHELLNGGAAFYRVYRCGDGAFVALGAIEAKFWAMFCHTVGNPEWAARQSDPFPQTDLISEVSAVLASQPRDHWLAAFEAVDCCFEPVLTPKEALEHPQAVARGMVSFTDEGGEVLFAAHADGHPPARRVPLSEVDAASVCDAWRTQE